MKAFRLVGNKMATKYPKMFVDVDEDGVVLGDGCSSLVHQLQDRNNYLNRPHKRPLKQNANENPVKNKKSNVVARVGCVNWDPPTPTVESTAIQTSDSQYAIQRDFINNENATIKAVIGKWPALFELKALFWHFNKLTVRNIDQLNIFVNEKYNKIFLYGKSLKKAPSSIKDNVSDSNGMLMNILHIFATAFKESVAVIYEMKVC